MVTLGLDIGSNSVGSAWIDLDGGEITTGTSIFPAGVDESDEKRGDPKNAKRRAARRARITLARRANRKRELKRKLIEVGLLPPSAAEFKKLLETTEPWALRRRGLDQALTPYEFGRVLLHLAQRRGALGLNLPDEEGEQDDTKDDGKVKQAIGTVRTKMRECKARSFGELMSIERDQRVTPIETKDRRPAEKRVGPREFRDAIRNKAGNYEHCADRAMIREEFALLWDAQVKAGGSTAKLLAPALRLALDDESGDSTWRHKGLLFGQRRQSWDLGTLGRCVLEPTERCVPHADMHASRYLVVETVNNLKIIERGREPESLTEEQRERILNYLSRPLGIEKGRKGKPDRPKTSVSVTDLRNLMGTSADGWGRSTKTSRFRFNIETDEDRTINTDWFSREIIHGAVTLERWSALPANAREGLNRAILKCDPDHEEDAAKLKKLAMAEWINLSEAQADALVAAWKRRPKLEKRLNMSRRAVRNLLTVMDRAAPWPDPNSLGKTRWLTQIEARKRIAGDVAFLDVTTGKPLDDHARRRYASGAKGATARDRYYMGKHVLLKDGKAIIGPDGTPLAEPPPAPLISNPVVRKAIHEVRRHLVEFMTTFRRKPDEVYIELAREAKMGKVDADRRLFQNRLQNRIRNEIVREYGLETRTATLQREGVKRVVLCVQQAGVCPLCGNQGVPTTITVRMAAHGEACEIAHIVPRGVGGDDRYSNIVLAHTKCNREMGRRTPRQYWGATLTGGFDDGIAWVENIYGDIKRIKPSESRTATGMELWRCYLTEPARPKRGTMSAKPPNFFTNRFDKAKIEQFKKDVKDIQEMTQRQEAATKYAARQVMAYVADALYDGEGLPERGGERRIFTTDGMWTSRLRREWGLFFDPHDARSHGLSNDEERQRKEKNRGDHRHHAIDAAVIALSSDQLKDDWKERERQADRDGVNTADEEAMENYRRNNPLPPPSPFKTREEFREAVRRAVFGDGAIEKPICHRPVKRKLIGALHKATQYGPVLDTWVQDGHVHREPVERRVTIRQDILGETQNDYLKPMHLRLSRPETDSEAVERLARRFRIGKRGMSEHEAIRAARKLVKSTSFARKTVDPKPEKGGIVRDPALRRLLRKLIEDRGLNPDSYSKAELKRSIDTHGPLAHSSGVPIHRVVLLWSNNDPVTIRRDHFDYQTGERRKLDDPVTYRLYDSQNNHHIEIREEAEGSWSGDIVTTFEAAQRKLARLRAFRKAGIPKPNEFRKLPKPERRKLTPVLRAIEQDHPLVDRRDNHAKGGRFVMSLCEGEMLFMKHKQTGEVGYFVVAKLDKPRSIVLVPHWDARAATERKDADGNKVPDSRREQFAVAPNDLKTLAPPGLPHAVKVRAGPLGDVTVLERD